jgi:alanine racemase
VRRTATIDITRLSLTLAELLENDDSLVVDARSDSYGHGSNIVVAAALDAGVTQILVSPDDDFRDRAVVTERSARPLVGAAVYGLDGIHPPIMTLAGEVIAVKRAEAGVGVSYGYSYRTVAQSWLALVGLGFADGVPRSASNRASVVISGSRYPVAGRIAMDQFVTDCADAEPVLGEPVVLFGDPALGYPSALEWASHTERSPLELTAGIGRRVSRVAQ